ncbi:hypothetical protein CRENPOLYSF1_330043 [Crenothrix polyspora]|uniref:Uncharacterized protein n=1 Tax=Crenothrix polyspora TaxID=360316 RepID=A0A1R4H932_9GAMM|nr:hypothetical protein CRENPOLYSF1_330043 [Crenothrix polyspora]
MVDINSIFKFLSLEKRQETEEGSRYFCERFFRDPARKISKNYATTNAFGCPSRPRFSRFRP